jgi:hypothetical protein
MTDRDEDLGLRIREHTIQIGIRSSSAGWDVLRGRVVIAWAWRKEEAETILEALKAKDVKHD